MKHPVAWHAPTPLWDLALADPGPARARFAAPALLRFASDAFMDRLAARLAQSPAGISELVAAPETWQQPAVGWQNDPVAAAAPVKLYQPVHERFYLVAASLVCQIAGLPERAVDPASEKVGFVLRRLLPADPETRSAEREQAWIGDRQQGSWVDLPDALTLAEGEERQPLFGLGFEHEGRRRKLWAGLVPVSGRELYEGEGAVDVHGARYVIRCVYERPRCAALADPVVSAPTRSFTMAGFFDPDAPARPLSIRLPIDTSTTGLARFPKAVSVLISDQLHRQLDRAERAGMGDLLDGNAPSEQPFNLGIVCSLSIPIISICALILLMLMVSLLNLVFGWLPLFKICRPLPLKA